MSQENVDVVRRAIDAFNRRDLDGFVRENDCEIVLDWSRSPGPEGGIYHGHEGVRRLLGSFYEAWDRITVSPEEFVERGNYVAVPNETWFWGRDGIKVEARGVFVNTLRNGRIAELRVYRDRAEALKAVGLAG
jgi:ketosteroid isomerase-like protein